MPVARKRALVGVAAIFVVAGCSHVAQERIPAPIPTTPPSTASPSPITPSPLSEMPTITLPDATPPVLRPGATGDLVRQVQARLGMIPTRGAYDSATAALVRNFQNEHGITPTGTLDTATWELLKSVTNEPDPWVVMNLKAPGKTAVAPDSNVEIIKDLQYRLSQKTSYASGRVGVYGPATTAAVREYQRATGRYDNGVVDVDMWAELRATTKEWVEPAWQIYQTPQYGSHSIPAQCLTGKVVCASMGQKRVSLVVDGKTILTLEARFGSATHPTRVGDFRVWHKNAAAVSTLFEGPPVSMPYSFFFDQARAVHFSQGFVTDGWYGTSHGCVNIRNLDAAKWLFDHVDVGDRVVVAP